MTGVTRVTGVSGVTRVTGVIRRTALLVGLAVAAPSAARAQAAAPPLWLIPDGASVEVRLSRVTQPFYGFHVWRADGPARCLVAADCAAHALLGRSARRWRSYC